MNSSDYIVSLRALNLWLEELESIDDAVPNPERDKIISQVNTCFNNVFKKFSEMYKLETGMEPPEGLREVMVYSKDSIKKNVAESSFKREVILAKDVISSISQLINEYDYVKLKEPFKNIDKTGRVYLNMEEAEALIELVIIEQKKALLKYPNYDKNLESYCLEHENMVLDIQQGLYEKVVLSVTEVFNEFDKECLI